MLEDIFGTSSTFKKQQEILESIRKSQQQSIDSNEPLLDVHLHPSYLEAYNCAQQSKPSHPQENFLSREEKKLSTFIDFTKSLSSLSTCKRKQVGSIIIPDDYSQIYSIGYNGQPSGISNEACNSQESNCGCIHAEMNALLKLRTHHNNLILISLLSPCKLCAGLILNSKQISKVIYIEEYKDLDPINMLSRYIDCVQY